MEERFSLFPLFPLFPLLPPSPAMAAPATETITLDPDQQQAVLARHRAMQGELRQVTGKIHELDGERSEHALVEKTIKDLDGGRRCFRMVGGVLVERTVADVLPAVRENMAGITKVMERLEETRREKERALEAFEKQFNIQRGRAPPPAEQQQQQQGGNGVLA